MVRVVLGSGPSTSPTECDFHSRVNVDIFLHHHLFLSKMLSSQDDGLRMHGMACRSCEQGGSSFCHATPTWTTTTRLVHAAPNSVLPSKPRPFACD